QQIGYVSENQDVPGWMTARQLLEYCRAMYPGWDDAFCDELRPQLDLPTDRPLGRLSRGARAKAVLLSSLAYRPRLLVLDERPSVDSTRWCGRRCYRPSGAWLATKAAPCSSPPTIWRRSSAWPSGSGSSMTAF